jgi:hypothetical protein
MNRRKIVLWVVCVIAGLVLVFAISIPNLMRSKSSANEANLASQIRTARTSQITAEQKAEEKLALVPQAAGPEKKLVYNAELGLKVKDVRIAIEQIQRLAESNHGEIDKIESTDRGGAPSATLEVRVPSSGLSTALAEFKKIAIKTEHEQLSAEDVTRSFYDNEAHMRNLRLEEQQYLSILKQAHTVKDILEVSEKLSGVRDRIERLQTQIDVMARDITMSQVTIVVMQYYDESLGSGWHPLNNAKIAGRELLVNLGDWIDWVVATLIKLPLIILWLVTVGAIVWICWRIIRYFRTQFRKPRTAQSS